MSGLDRDDLIPSLCIWLSFLQAVLRNVSFDMSTEQRETIITITVQEIEKAVPTAADGEFPEMKVLSQIWLSTLMVQHLDYSHIL